MCHICERNAKAVEDLQERLDAAHPNRVKGPTYNLPALWKRHHELLSQLKVAKRDLTKLEDFLHGGKNPVSKLPPRKSAESDGQSEMF